MTVWLLWTVSDETLEEMLLSVHATVESAEAAFRAAGVELDELWISEWPVSA